MIDLDFIAELEGFSTVGYVPTKGGRVLGHSGVTVGLGVDLGQQSLSSFVLAGVSGDIMEKCYVYLGVRGELALRLVRRFPLELSEKEARELSLCIIEKSKESLAAYIGNWDELTDRQQTVVFSVFHQYGLRGAPRFMSYAKARDWASVHAELLDFGDKYRTRRRKEAEYLYGTQDGDSWV